MGAFEELKEFLPVLNKWDLDKFIKENIMMEEDNIDKKGFYIVNSETELAIRISHKETGNDVMVRVYSTTPVLNDKFKKELVELIKNLVNPSARRKLE